MQKVKRNLMVQSGKFVYNRYDSIIMPVDCCFTGKQAGSVAVCAVRGRQFRDKGGPYDKR